METRTYNVYSFEEASEELQKKILNKNRSYNTEDIYWYTSVTENFKDEMEENGFRIEDVFFSGFGSQGDGASFTGNFNLAKYMESHGLTETYKNLYEFLCENDYDYSMKITREGHYVHEETMDISFGYAHFQTDNEKVLVELAEIVEVILEDMKGIARKLYKDLEEEYEALESDEYLKEVFVEGNYKFTEDGDIDS